VETPLKQQALIAGVGTTRFAKHLDRSLSSLAHEAINAALADAGIGIERIQAAWSGNAAAAILTGQVCIAGQTILRGLGLGRIPVTNVENACATASTAFHEAAAMVTLGAYDVVLAFGVEKLCHPDKGRALSVFTGCADTEHPEDLRGFVVADPLDPASAGTSRSVFMDIYARWARDYMRTSGATSEDFASVVAKNSLHGSLNPYAQFTTVVSAAEVLRSPPVVHPLTLKMCSPVADGAAAIVLMSSKAARETGARCPVRVLSSVLASGYDEKPGDLKLLSAVGREVLEAAGIGSADLSCIELHDATAPAELMCYEALGLCGPGDSVGLLCDGTTKLGGRLPVNTSGGLVRRGHPIGATGLAQLHELVLQLRGHAGPRQVDLARFGLAENGGGFIHGDSAALVITVLGRG
jgi:acetyl-CoA acetyltransferase